MMSYFQVTTHDFSHYFVISKFSFIKCQSEILRYLGAIFSLSNSCQHTAIAGIY